MWSLVEKNPKETRILEIQGKFMRIKKIIKNIFFSIGAASTLLAIWSIWIKIKPNKKAKLYKIGANWMEFQQSMSYNL
jgi:hypothetical protein